MLPQKRNYDNILKSLFLISLLFFASFSILFVDSLNQNNAPVYAAPGKMKVRLEISVYDSEGNLKDQVIKDDDLILTNFIKYLTAFFTDDYPTAVEIDLQDITDTQRTFIVRKGGTTSTNTVTDSESDTEDKGGWIGIGTDATAPTRADVDLGTQQEALTQNDANYPAYSSGSGHVVCQSTITSTGTYNVVEAGYYVNWVDELGTVRTIMLLHDVFNPVGVIPTDDIVISYSIILDGPEFNRNFGNWLAVLLGTCADGDDEFVTFYNIAAGEVSCYIYISIQSGWIGEYDADQDINANVYFRISTSDTTPTRTTNQITGIVESYYRPNPLPYYEATNTTIETAITVSANREIQASALYLYVPSTVEVFYEILFIHATFSTAEIESGTALNIIDLLTYT